MLRAFTFPQGPAHMRRSLIAASAVLLLGLTTVAVASKGGLLDRSYRPLASKTPVELDKTYGGDVVLVVNTASKCGFTPQFEALEALHKKYAGKGFAVLGFPSGDFKAQEFDDEQQIQEFCKLTYGVKFPMFEKVHVVGADATPLYKDLAQVSNDPPKWNFHKYLIGRDGRLIASWGSKTTPDDAAIVEAIEQALKAPRPKGA